VFHCGKLENDLMDLGAEQTVGLATRIVVLKLDFGPV
jgi:hypothetical protein